MHGIDISRSIAHIAKLAARLDPEYHSHRFTVKPIELMSFTTLICRGAQHALLHFARDEADCGDVPRCGALAPGGMLFALLVFDRGHEPRCSRLQPAISCPTARIDSLVVRISHDREHCARG